MRKGLTEGSVAGLYIIVPTGQEKKSLVNSTIILVFYKLLKSDAPKAMEATPLHASPWLQRL